MCYCNFTKLCAVPESRKDKTSLVEKIQNTENFTLDRLLEVEKKNINTQNLNQTCELKILDEKKPDVSHIEMKNFKVTKKGKLFKTDR